MKGFGVFWTAVLVCAGMSLSAADWYVSIGNGSNKNDGQTPAAPLKNLWKAVEKAAPGDTIRVATGNYPGKMACGWIRIDKPVKIYGGYAPDFSARDIIKYPTMMRPTNAQNQNKPSLSGGTLAIVTGDTQTKRQQFARCSQVVIDGLIFDHTDANNYHATEGKPAGFTEGMLTIPPARGSKPLPSIDRYMLYTSTDGELIIRNCLFLNSSNYAVNINHFSGKVSFINNVIIGSRMMGVNVRSANGKPFMVEYEFAYNTVLFTWTRTKEFSDMGYGVRDNYGVTSNIHHNIIGLNCMSGFDNAMGDPRFKKTKLDHNIFFMNKKADVALTIGATIKFMKMGDPGFEDMEEAPGIESLQGNIALADPTKFKGVIDENYLKAFLSATYTEKADFDRNSPANVFRSTFGLNMEGTITSKVSMFANPYPYDSAVKFFGVMPGYGAQKVE